MIERIVDKLNGTIADIIATVLYVIIGIRSIYAIFNVFIIINEPVIRNANPNIHGIFIILCLVTFYISLLGKYYRKPSRRIIQYISIVFGISIFSMNYLAETFNSLFINIIKNIKNIDVIPPDLLMGNLRVVTVLLPISIIIPIFYLSLTVLKDKRSKGKLREYEVPLLLPSVHEFKDYTIDLEICKDLVTGLPCIVPEKILYEHIWLQGGTGSGKTSNNILPIIEQLLKKKAYLTHKLKTIAIQCLNSGIAIINQPISNKWFNENFDMDLIQPKKGKEKEFYEAFNKYTIGIMKKEELVFEDTFAGELKFNLKELKSDDYKYQIELLVSKNGMLHYEERLDITKGNETSSIESEFIKVQIDFSSDSVLERMTSDLKDKEFLNVNEYTKNIFEESNDCINIDLIPKNKDYTYKVRVFSKGNGRLVPRNLGMTVVAPDGELVSKALEIAKDYGIKIHKIDPFMDEIKKGNVAKFNPLKGDSPEKIGDIVASILVNMDLGPNSKTNPYFTNAGVRAVRNLVILLKISYPHLFNREPTLEDVLACMNNFDLVEQPVAYVISNPSLLKRWRSIIDYFRTRFLDIPKDHDGKSTNSGVGSLKKQTQQAIEGIVNQLDNLLSREEIRYILCNEEESIDLAQVLKKGECIGISTRQGNLGPTLGRAFALFFILSLQNEVLSRYTENENPEIPHFIEIDEFPIYCNESTETFFSFSRKYKCSVAIAIQNMGQLKKISDEFGETIFTNTTTKLLLPKSNLEDRKYWSDYFGSVQEMQVMTGISTSSIFSDNPNYSESMRGTMEETRNISEEEIDNLNFQQLYYSYQNKKGRKKIGKGSTEFLQIEKEPYMNDYFDFEPFAISEKDYNRMFQLRQKNVQKKKEEKIINKMVMQNINKKDSLFKDAENISDTENNFLESKKDKIIQLPMGEKHSMDSKSIVLMEEFPISNIDKIQFEPEETKDINTINTNKQEIESPKGKLMENSENKENDIEFLIFEDDERSL